MSGFWRMGGKEGKRIVLEDRRMQLLLQKRGKPFHDPMPHNRELCASEGSIVCLQSLSFLFAFLFRCKEQSRAERQRKTERT